MSGMHCSLCEVWLTGEDYCPNCGRDAEYPPQCPNCEEDIGDPDLCEICYWEAD